jgi:hypothetical protein
MHPRISAHIGVGFAVLALFGLLTAVFGVIAFPSFMCCILGPVVGEEVDRRGGLRFAGCFWGSIAAGSPSAGVTHVFDSRFPGLLGTFGFLGAMVAVFFETSFWLLLLSWNALRGTQEVDARACTTRVYRFRARVCSQLALVLSLFIGLGLIVQRLRG